MKVTKDKSTGVYVVAFRTEHGRKKLSTGCTNESDANEVVKRAKVRELEMAARATKLTQSVVSQIVVGKKVSMEKASMEWEEWLKSTAHAPRTVLCHAVNVNSWIRDAKLEQLAPGSVNEKHIDKWINDKTSKTKAGSRNVLLSSIRSFCKFCIAKGYMIANPSALVRVRMDILDHSQKEPKQRQPFTDVEVHRMLKETEDFWHVAIALGRWTGLRLGDISQLEWDCFGHGTITVWTDKRDRRVQLPLNAELAEAVAKIPVNNSKYCFPEQRDIYLNPKKHGMLPTQFKRICAALDMPTHSFHDLRHTYASDCAKRGIPVEHIRINMAHAHSTTTEGYIHE